MSTYCEYAILQGTTPEDLSTEVSEAMNEGWTLHAGPIIFFVEGVGHYYQAVKKEDDIN